MNAMCFCKRLSNNLQLDSKFWLKNWITCLLNYFEQFDNNLLFASKNIYSFTTLLFLLLNILDFQFYIGAHSLHNLNFY